MRKRHYFAAAPAVLCLLLAACTPLPAGRSSGATHAGQQTPAEDFSASAGNSMSGQMDNSIKGEYRENETASAPQGDSRNGSIRNNAVRAAGTGAAAQNLPTLTPLPGVRMAETALRQDTIAPPKGSTPQEYTTVTPDAQDLLVLVNDSHRLPQDYTPPLAAVPGSEKQLHTAAAAALARMMAAAKEEGCPLHLVSGYRSVKYQQGLFSRKVQSCLNAGLPAAEAEAEAAKWVARPGASEHALGLAADLVSGDWYLTHEDLTQEFETTSAFAWLCAHGAEYGFILRYPADKEAITGVHYEPWHWRYVGEAAGEIAASSLCLEEWLAR